MCRCEEFRFEEAGTQLVQPAAGLIEVHHRKLCALEWRVSLSVVVLSLNHKVSLGPVFILNRQHMMWQMTTVLLGSRHTGRRLLQYDNLSPSCDFSSTSVRSVYEPSDTKRMQIRQENLYVPFS